MCVPAVHLLLTAMRCPPWFIPHQYTLRTHHLKVSVARFSCCTRFGSAHFFSCFRFCLTFSSILFWTLSNVLYSNLLHSFDIFSRIYLSWDNAGRIFAYVCMCEKIISYICVFKKILLYICMCASACVTCPMKLYPFTPKSRKKNTATVH